MLKNPRNTLWLYRNSRFNKNIQKDQKYRRFFVLDFEATCDQGASLKPMEIIELPCLEVSSSDFSIVSKFHRFVKPKINPCLTPFCTQLTGISQDAVNKEREFPEVFDDFLKWLRSNVDKNNPDDAIFVTCGTWDLFRMLPEQCELCNIDLPPEFLRFINIKTAFYHALGHYPRSIPDMFKILKLQMKGRLHRGLDDCINIIQIMKYLATDGYVFEETDNSDRADKGSYVR